MIAEIILYISWLFIILGCFFILTGSIGIIRMPDFFTRLHPAGITDAMGAPMVLLGIAIQDGFTLFSGKIILLIIFLLFTGPTSTHANAKSAVLSGLKPLDCSTKKENK